MIANSIPPVALDWVLDALHRQVDQLQEEANALKIMEQHDQLPNGVLDAYQGLMVEIEHLKGAMSELEKMAKQGSIPVTHPQRS